MVLLIGLPTIGLSVARDHLPTYNGTQSVCWVNLFDNTESAGWLLTGASPYLHNNSASYITSLTAGNCSWFHFQDTDLATLQNVFLMIEWRTRDVMTGGEAGLYLNNGVSETSLGSFDLTLEYRWTGVNVTGFLNTPTKVNDAKLKIKSLYSGLYLVAVRRAYLRVYNGPVPLQTGTPEYGKPWGEVTLSVKWTDPDGLISYAMNHNASGSWLSQNLTGALSETEAWSNHSVRLPLDTASILAYRFWASDSSGNWERTGILFVYPVKSFNPELLKWIGDVAGSPISHSYGRKDFYDTTTERFWKFFSDGVNMKYTSTADGQVWLTPLIVRQAESGFMFYVHVSMGTVHYVYNSEKLAEDVYYRKGHLNVDGTITWAASEQVAVDAGTSLKFYACSVVSDNNGYPCIVFGNRTNPNSKTLRLVKSDYNNGIWHTAPGFPKQINADPDADLVSGVALDLPDNKIYIVYCSAGSEEPPRGRLLNEDGTLGSLENASAYVMSSNYPFSAVSDKLGNVHIAYRRTGERIDYSFRQSATGSWTVMDELVTSYVTGEVLGSTLYSWPVIGCSPARAIPHMEEVYVHWWTLEDKSAWLEIRNATSWEPRKRLLRLANDETLIDGDVSAPHSSSSKVLLNFVTQNVIDERTKLWAYVYVNKPPVVSFTESAETVPTGETIAFDASGSYDVDGAIVSYFWDFGDGRNATGATSEHGYSDDGDYTVFLAIIDDDGAFGLAAATKTVLNRPPHAALTVSASIAYPTMSITFNASASYDPDGAIVSYFWEFGDGENASEVAVEHAYATEGNFTAILKVTDDDGAADTANATIAVLRRDVALSGLTLSKRVVGVGYKMSMTVSVENQGRYTEEVNVTATANLGPIQTKSVLLAVNESAIITFTWNTVGWAKGNYTIHVTASAVPGEIDTVDNVVFDGPVLVTLPGDVDGDRDVDIFDLVRISGVYSVKKPDPRYDVNCDIDDDGDIDIFDLVITAGNYGEYW